MNYLFKWGQRVSIDQSILYILTFKIKLFFQVPPMPPPPNRDQLDNFRCDPVVYQRQIQGKNGTFYDHMNVNQAVAPVPINGDNMRYSSYTGTYVQVYTT